MELEVVDKNAKELLCKAKNAGRIAVRKNVNVPGVSLNLPSLSGRDEEFIRYAAHHQIDYIAHSFVRNRHDIKAVQDILDAEGSAVKIIAKIENTAGLYYLEQYELLEVG